MEKCVFKFVNANNSELWKLNPAEFEDRFIETEGFHLSD